MIHFKQMLLRTSWKSTLNFIVDNYALAQCDYFSYRTCDGKIGISCQPFGGSVSFLTATANLHLIKPDPQ